jgi:hypothetical protein
VGSKHVRDRARKRYVPELAALGRSEHGLAAAQLELLDHMQRARREVDRVDGETEDFALPESTPGAQVDHRSEAFGHRVPDGEDPFRRPRGHALGVNDRRPDRTGSTRVPGRWPSFTAALRAARTLE